MIMWSSVLCWSSFLEHKSTRQQGPHLSIMKMPDSNSTQYTAGTQLFIDSLNEGRLNGKTELGNSWLSLRKLNSTWELRGMQTPCYSSWEAPSHGPESASHSTVEGGSRSGKTLKAQSQEDVPRLGTWNPCQLLVSITMLFQGQTWTWALEFSTQIKMKMLTVSNIY